MLGQGKREQMTNTITAAVGKIDSAAHLGAAIIGIAALALLIAIAAIVIAVRKVGN